MTAEGIAQILTAVGMVITAVGTVLNGRQGRANGRKMEAIHQSTNGLSERNEAIARKLGVEEGKESQRVNPT